MVDDPNRPAPAPAATGAAARHDGEILRVVADALPLVLAYVDRGEVYRFANRFYEERYGRGPGRVVGRHAREVLGAEGYARVAPYMHRALAGETVTFETRVDRPDGEALHVSATYVPDVAPDGAVLGFAAVSEDITARRRAEEQSAAREREFRQLADAMANMVWATDPSGRVEFCNARWFEYTGIAPGALDFASWRDTVHPDDLPEVLRRHRHAVAARETFVAEYRIRRHDGAYRWFLTRTVFAHDAQGQPARRFGSATDIHDQKLSERRSALQARAAAELTSVTSVGARAERAAALAVELVGGWAVVHRLEDDGTLTPRGVAHADPSRRADVASVYARRTEFAGAEQRGTREVVRTGVSRFGADGVLDGLRRTMHDETLMALLASIGLRGYACVPLRTRGVPSGALTVGTGERALEAVDLAALEELGRTIAWALENAALYGAQQRSLALLETLLGSAPIGLVFYDRDLRHAYANHALAQMRGMPAREALGRTLDEVVPEIAADVMPVLRQVLATGEPVLARETEASLGGAPRSFLASFYPVRAQGAEGDGLLGVGAVVADVTEQKRARAALEDAVRTRDEFLATLSHELRTPLNAVLGYVSMLRMGMLAPERTAHALEVVERNARAQARLVEDLLDASRIVSGKMHLALRPTLPAEVLTAALDAVRPAAAAKSIRLDAELAPPRGAIMVDPDRLQQIAWNLLSNAIRFTPAGGRVVLGMTETARELVVTVQDTGCGIRPELVPHVFERFRQGEVGTSRTHGGLGLGLAIVKHLVELHGGTVTAESAGEGAGATFRVVLPRVPTA